MKSLRERFRLALPHNKGTWILALVLTLGTVGWTDLKRSEPVALDDPSNKVLSELKVEFVRREWGKTTVTDIYSAKLAGPQGVSDFVRACERSGLKSWSSGSAQIEYLKHGLVSIDNTSKDGVHSCEIRLTATRGLVSHVLFPHPDY